MKISCHLRFIFPLQSFVVGLYVVVIYLLLLISFIILHLTTSGAVASFSPGVNISRTLMAGTKADSITHPHFLLQYLLTGAAARNHYGHFHSIFCSRSKRGKASAFTFCVIEYHLSENA